MIPECGGAIGRSTVQPAVVYRPWQILVVEDDWPYGVRQPFAYEES